MFFCALARGEGLRAGAQAMQQVMALTMMSGWARSARLTHGLISPRRGAGAALA
jgi:hypothetical protein